MLPSNASEWETVNPPPPRKGGPHISGGLILTVVLLVMLVGVIAFAITRLPTGPLAATRPAVATSAPAPAAAGASPVGGVTADGATQQAIQDVIRRLDEAQATAIATNNPQVMAETATPSFYQEQIAINADLVNSGVTEVKLLNMEWGPITVNGNNASATVYETWSTTFDDGTTAQSRDRNVYTLVKDQNGAWKVAADDHPDQQ
jgi:ketosteroid isomerase-like protein